jgi:hypothetical protein
MPPAVDCSHLIVSIGLRRRASARADFRFFHLAVERERGGETLVGDETAIARVDRLSARVDRGVVIPEAKFGTAQYCEPVTNSRITRTQPHRELQFGFAFLEAAKRSFRQPRST